MGDLARRLVPLLALFAACGRQALPGNPRYDGSTEPPPSVVEPPGANAGQPIYRESTERFTQIAAGWANTCGVTTDGRVRCWGMFGDCRDIEGECPASRGNYVPKRADQTAKRLSVEVGRTCAIAADDSIDCWGGWLAPPAHVDGAFAALSIPYAIQASDGAIVYFDSAHVPPPDASWALPPIPAGSFIDVSGYQYYCGLRSDGTLACWGSRRNDGVVELPPSGSFVQIVGTSDFSCALQADGEVSCWGPDVGSRNRNGPGRVPQPGGPFVQLAAAFSAVCGIREDASVACWGFLSGNVPPEGTYTQVAVGDSNSDSPAQDDGPFFCALRPGGIAVCWGVNNWGESSPP